METSEWIEHDGNGMPVDGGVMVAVRFRDGDEMFALPASVWDASDRDYSNWHSKPDETDIVAYRILKETAGEA